LIVVEEEEMEGEEMIIDCAQDAESHSREGLGEDLNLLDWCLTCFDVSFPAAADSKHLSS